MRESRYLAVGNSKTLAEQARFPSAEYRPFTPPDNLSSYGSKAPAPYGIRDLKLK
jgi:hypothetical protein